MQFAVLPLLLMKLLRVEYIREKKGREWSVGEEEGSIAEERRAGSECCERSKSKESEEYFYCTLVGTRRIGTLWWSPMVLQNTRVSKFTGGFADGPQHDEQVGFPPVV
jgi:hypothetical protein